MNGLEMMLKSMGVNVDTIKKELTAVLDETVRNIKAEQDTIKETLSRIEGKLDIVLAKGGIQIDTGFGLPEGVVESGNIDGPSHDN